MKKYVKIIDKQTFAIQVGIGTDEQYYISQGFQLMQVQQDIYGNYYLSGHKPQYIPTIQDYDKILEQHISNTCKQRGYITRQPDVYLNSKNERWKQDALDFIDFRDECMTYGLEIENKYKNGQSVPTLKQFKQTLPKIKWTFE